MCGVCTEEVSWSASFSGFDAGDLIAAKPVTNDFCFQIRQTWTLQRDAPVRTKSANPPAATVNLPAATVNLPAATVNLPAATVNPPAATVNLPAATVNPPAATVNPVGALHAGKE